MVHQNQRTSTQWTKVVSLLQPASSLNSSNRVSYVDVGVNRGSQLRWSHLRRLLYHFAVDLPTLASLRKDALARVRIFVLSTNDPAPETWCETCTACCKPIVGCRSMCRMCPKTLFFFCSACVQQQSARVQSFCKHDPSASVYETVTPPRRFLFEVD
ncbi:hypothetical protein SPRG_12271 [Saprolegnia parasitica CBS 223.65]|uniref:Uncharacterized protein n=1 Tax=Saprolegnia parasitica (strain CBS 223.65) TaxID=695850 RepID=A0A067C777_SAPPC|nr:hypothetical protein SPRG_12271 [Saprolegnia parasitica CBS 223.65]KDO22642.1 hypothetical protein SPRG_12271 [Saprolegnia parasitica CBS 223.65]|eukprot:XP_012206650.1 hypothetical protein SPRG_12271 [Saprolegnia parasitica CBS 223.65]